MSSAQNLSYNLGALVRTLEHQWFGSSKLGNIAKDGDGALARRRSLPRGQRLKLEQSLDLIRLVSSELGDFPALQALASPGTEKRVSSWLVESFSAAAARKQQPTYADTRGICVPM
jgi:hypothetical protein